LAVLFGPKAVSIISQDDKAKVPLGLPAAKRQGPILMKMDYRVQLPDHDFVIATKHKLIPSVYAALEIQNDKVTYSGPTYIAIRSGKHDSSTAPRHADDLHRLFHLKEFQNFCQVVAPIKKSAPIPDPVPSLSSNESEPITEPVPSSSRNESAPITEPVPSSSRNESAPIPEPVPSSSGDVPVIEKLPIKPIKVKPIKIKPILILLVDGGPDEGPRYPKTLKFAALNFVKFNLDAMFVATHAPGQSASNPVERRMAPLSRDLCGIILPHDVFGSHLDKNGKTVDMELEKNNFQKAGELLADVWSERVIDKYPVIAEFVMPGKNKRTTVTLKKPEEDGTDSVNQNGTGLIFLK
jgi:hypothetical protein